MMKLIQAYLPTSVNDDKDVNTFYEDVDDMDHIITAIQFSIELLLALEQV